MDKQNERFLQFIDSEYKELFNFKSSEIEAELENRINKITTLLKEKSIFKLHYDDLLFYERGIETMPSYYGSHWTSKYFFPFIQKNNPDTMLILEFITLVYSKSVYEMVSSDINQIEKEEELFFDKKTLDFLIKENKSSEPHERVQPVMYYISILKELFVKQPTTRELYVYGDDTFYITTEMYRNITDKLLDDTEEASFKEVIGKIIGMYTLYFTKITYFTEIQPLFLKIIDDCLLNYEEISTFNNQLFLSRLHG